MMSSNTSRVAAVLLAASLAAAAAVGCSSDSTGGTPTFPTAGASPGAGSGNVAGTTATAGAGGSAPVAGAGGATPVAGAGGAGGAAPTAGAGGSTPTAGAGGAGADPITAIVKTAGCGMDPTGLTPGQGVKGTILTEGTKAADAADSKKGAWSYTREYYVTLPANYDKNKAYPIVFQGPGCGGGGQNVYALTDGMAANAGNTVIRVGLTPPPNDIGHATNPGQGCFDDKEGDDSVDWVFYEKLYDKLAAQVCFDKNRVFASGDSSGAWFSNELGCKYAGDATRPVRGIMPNTGGLPTDVKHVPTCTQKPMAGMWVHETGDMTNQFTGNKVAIARAMAVNKCTIGNSYDNAMFEDYKISATQTNVCKKIKGCPELYPLVVCPLDGTGHGSHPDVTNPGFSTFLKMFQTGAFVTQ